MRPDDPNCCPACGATLVLRRKFNGGNTIVLIDAECNCDALKSLEETAQWHLDAERVIRHMTRKHPTWFVI